MSYLHPLRCSAQHHQPWAWKCDLLMKLSYSSHLQRHSFDRRTNQGTPQLLCEKIQHSLKIFTQKSTPWSMAWQENHSRELFKMIIFTLSSEILSETLWISFTCEKFKFSWNQGCLQNVESCFSKSRLISRLIEIKVKFMSWLKIKVVFKTHQNPPFIQLSIKYNSKNKWAEKKFFFPYVALLQYKSQSKPITSASLWRLISVRDFAVFCNGKVKHSVYDKLEYSLNKQV